MPGHGQALPERQSSASGTELGTRETLGVRPEPVCPRREASAFMQRPRAVPAGHLWGRAPTSTGPAPISLLCPNTALCRGSPGLARLQPLHVPSTQHKGGHPLPGAFPTLPHFPTQISRFCLQFLELGEKGGKKEIQLWDFPI